MSKFLVHYHTDAGPQLFHVLNVDEAACTVDIGPEGGPVVVSSVKIVDLPRNGFATIVEGPVAEEKPNELDVVRTQLSLCEFNLKEAEKLIEKLRIDVQKRDAAVANAEKEIAASRKKEVELQEQLAKVQKEHQDAVAAAAKADGVKNESAKKEDAPKK